MPPRILIIDDDPDLREIVELKLTISGFETDTAVDGEAGLAAAVTTAPDLVLVDWMMPKMTGLEVCQAMRDNENTRRTPIILLTAKAQVADVERGFAAGADDYLVKPFSPTELLARITAALGRAA
jgi:two-component system phosphate regulon response regulator PhoB